MASQTFHFREDFESPRDSDWILAAFDGALPHMAAKGSGQQWGSRPFSERDGARDRVAGWLTMSETSRRRRDGDGEVKKDQDGGGGGGEEGRLFIAEVELPADADTDADTAQGWRVRTDETSGKRFLSVAAGGVRTGWWPTYFQDFEQTKQLIKEADAEGGVMYLEVLISDFRTGSHRKGAGGALVAKIKEYALSQGAKTMYLDCFAGNGGLLVK
ncbi:hypothetical protein PFICI_13334 [Pestalotiopsis fici W106-1]|uniref:N-acetyltransferase domain-containing protein n=1 Tax=Pestalotiopsis fici (strain W106-1 / CGMCC3.15140) TaxID=1229662 RepID=W3WLR0_PESFW|nr:uncharacterized protein PFICI_13334 [Pestalotiopsis fici W106-1]ETS74850.1 hypothetical protein PFICI_13334 [Pestalotiopsis fici W106-1]